MAFRFSKRSLNRLATCDERIQLVMVEVIRHVDCTILEGHRGKKAQNEAFRQGRSKVQFPNGKHNTSPSLAVDVAPYPIDWKDRERFTLFAGFVLGIARGLDPNLNLRWGGDWNQNWQVKDNRFDDLVHFEIRG